MISKEEELEIILLSIIENSLKETRTRRIETAAKADLFEHKLDLRFEANQAEKDHYNNVLEMYKVLLDPNMRNHVDKSFPLIYRYMKALEHSKGF